LIHIAQILPDNGYSTGHCGASLVAPDLVLTAAHCVDSPYWDNWLVVVGVHERYNMYDDDEEGEVRSCTQVIMHPEYNGMGEYDIALCLLSDTVNIEQALVYLELNDNESVPADDEMLTLIGLGTTRRRRSLEESDSDCPKTNSDHTDVPTMSPGDSSNSFVTEDPSDSPTMSPTDTLGPTATMYPTSTSSSFPTSASSKFPFSYPTWSPTELNTDWSPKILQTVKLPFLNNQRCQDLHSVYHLLRPWYGPVFNVTKEVLCAWDSTGQTSSCYGDSGGPLVSISQQDDGRIRHTQVGLVSGGYGGCATMPNVYTNVAALSDWIKDTACNNMTSVADFCDPCYKSGKSEKSCKTEKSTKKGKKGKKSSKS